MPRSLQRTCPTPAVSSLPALALALLASCGDVTVDDTPAIIDAGASNPGDAAPDQNTADAGTANPADASADQGDWQLVWEDTFDGAGQPNAENWNYQVGNGFNPGINAFQGWGNGEWEWYRPESSYQEDGNLVIRADYDTEPMNISGIDWYQRSGRVTTQGKHTWTYGRVEARIAIPRAIGTWPTFALMGSACDDTYTEDYDTPLETYDVMPTNWPSCGEIDIMLHRNTETAAHQNLFWDSRVGLFPSAPGFIGQSPGQVEAGDVTAFHLYTIEWEPGEIRWYLDRESNPNPVHTVAIAADTMEEFQAPFHLVMSLALSGTFTGNLEPNAADFPLFMRVDYVRVWQRE